MTVVERGRAEVSAQIRAEYEARTPASAEMFERARRVMPGGTTGNLRYFEPHPLYFAGGDAATTTDLDGTVYTDLFLCNGPLLLGHRHPAVERAVDEARSV